MYAAETLTDCEWEVLSCLVGEISLGLNYFYAFYAVIGEDFTKEEFVAALKTLNQKGYITEPQFERVAITHLGREVIFYREATNTGKEYEP
jgi:hypothetical protein